MLRYFFIILISLNKLNKILISFTTIQQRSSVRLRNRESSADDRIEYHQIISIYYYYYIIIIFSNRIIFNNKKNIIIFNNKKNFIFIIIALSIVFFLRNFSAEDMLLMCCIIISNYCLLIMIDATNMTSSWRVAVTPSAGLGMGGH